jgi:DNA-binding IclR family transcriptional regulator
VAIGANSVRPWGRSKRTATPKGEFNPGVYSVAAPILTDQKTSLGSVGVAWNEKERRDVDVEHAVLAVKQAATTISDRLMEKQPTSKSPIYSNSAESA